MTRKSNESRIDAFNEKHAPFSLIEYDDGKFGLSLCMAFGNGDYCIDAFDIYAKSIGEDIVDSRGFYTHGTGYEWEAAFVKCFENEPGLKLIEFDSEGDGFYCYCDDLGILEDLGRRFKTICEDTVRFVPLLSAGIREAEQRRYDEARLMQTVRGYLLKNPHADFDIRTPDGNFYVRAGVGKELITGNLDSIVSEDGETRLTADEFLEQKVISVQQDLFNEDFFQMRAEIEQDEDVGFSMTM